jgi:hypothetical protein
MYPQEEDDLETEKKRKKKVTRVERGEIEKYEYR